MITTKKRITVALSKKELEELEELIKFYEDSQSIIIRRAISNLHSKLKNK